MSSGSGGGSGGIQVIGAGAGRTGTASLKRALEILGFDPCYHMTEVLKNGQSPSVAKALTADKEEWREVLKGYKATVDFPACVAYKDLMELYPEAKVVLSVRDTAGWVKSVQETIWNPRGFERSWVAAPWLLGFQAMARAFRGRFFEGAGGGAHGVLDDPARLAASFERWNEEVKQSVPAGRLLVFQAKDGWAPLCKFLGVPVPSEPFPNVNDTQEFKSRLAKMWRTFLVMDIAVLSAAAAVAVGCVVLRRSAAK